VTVSLSKVQARRIAVAAQGFLDPPHATSTMRTLERTVSRVGVIQVDSVNVLQRAHYMPFYSRMGPYDEDLLRRASQRRPRRLIEYWAHVQALMPVDLWPVMRHRMDSYRARAGKWYSVQANPGLEASLLAELRERGASTARDLDDGLPRKKENWGWNWSETRKVLDFLFVVGDVAIAGRNGQFEVVYDLPERVLPRQVLDRPIPPLGQAHRELVRRAAVSHGVATIQCLRDYYRMGVAEVGPAVRALVESGELEEARIEGWDRPAYLHRDARLPRKVQARALLSPFDPLCWERNRTEHLFDFHYRIEIYVPQPKRIYGYYVLPFLLGDRMVARVDLKADRSNRRLLVKGAYAEDSAPPDTAEELAGELLRLAGWLGLESVVVERRGDLAPRLAAANHGF
jgi:uncharacterized protein YcaQ